MKNQSLFVAIVVGAAALFTLAIATAHQPQGTADARLANDAAYRDGLYQARRDASQKHPAHITSGRWSTGEDRASFIAGYLQGYHDQTAHGVKLGATDLATLTGYSEGMADGAHDRKASLPFQVARSQRTRQAELVYGQVAGVYRQAYANGYQQAYYSADDSTVGVVGQTSQKF
jgi:hypothetical protein